MNIDMDGSFIDPALGELERAVLAEERAEKAEIQLEQMGDLLKIACEQRDHFKARVAELEAEVIILRELEQPAKDAAEILLDFHDINPPRVVIGRILERLTALRAGRGEAIK